MQKKLENMTLEDAENMFQTLLDYYRHFIRESAEKAGGMKKFSRELGFNENYIFKLLNNKKIDTVRMNVLKIQDYLSRTKQKDV